LIYQTSILTAGILIGFVLAVGLAVAEEFLVEALAITARKFAIGTDGFIRFQDGLRLAWSYIEMIKGFIC